MIDGIYGAVTSGSSQNILRIKDGVGNTVIDIELQYRAAPAASGVYSFRVDGPIKVAETPADYGYRVFLVNASGVASQASTINVTILYHFENGGTIEIPQLPDITYFLDDTNNILYARSTFSDTKDIVQSIKLSVDLNHHVDVGHTYLVSKEAEYSISTYLSSELYSSGADAANLSSGNCDSFFGPHGMLIAKITSVGHGKTLGDVASIYSDGTHQYIITNIVDTDTIELMCLPYAQDDTWAMTADIVITAPLTHVSGGSDFTSITASNKTTSTIWDLVTNINITKCTSTGLPLVPNAHTIADKIIITEEFDVINPSTLTHNSPWDWTDGDVWFHVKNIFTIYNATITQEVTYNFYADISIAACYSSLVTPKNVVGVTYDSRYFFIPKVLAARAGGVNWRVPQLCNSTITPLILSSFACDYSPANRVVTLYANDADTAYAIGFAVGVFEIDDGVTATRNTATDGSSVLTLSNVCKSYMQILGTHYLTPHAISKTNGDTLHFIAYKTWFNPTNQPKSISTYIANQGNSAYIFIDCFDETDTAVVLPSWTWGRKITVIESETCSTPNSTVPKLGIRVTTAGTYGFLVLKLD